MKATLSATVFTFITVCNSLKLREFVKPTTFQKCNKKSEYFDDCLSSAIQNAIKQLDKPFPEYGLPNMEPLSLQETFKAGNSSNGLSREYKNVKAYGHTKFTEAKASMDFGKNILFFEISLPELVFECDYTIFGSFIILPMNSSGQTIVRFVKPLMKFMFNLNNREKEDGLYYYKLVKSDMDLKIDMATFKYTNLFDDENFNNDFNLQLNAHWQAIYEYLMHKRYPGYLEHMYARLLSNFLDKVPITEFFDGVE